MIWASCFAVAAVGGHIAARHGCHLDEGGVHPCMVQGKDIGPELANYEALGLLGAFGSPFFLIPIAICLFIAGARALQRNAERG